MAETGGDASKRCFRWGLDLPEAFPLDFQIQARDGGAAERGGNRSISPNGSSCRDTGPLRQVLRSGQRREC